MEEKWKRNGERRRNGDKWMNGEMVKKEIWSKYILFSIKSVYVGFIYLTTRSNDQLL